MDDVGGRSHLAGTRRDPCRVGTHRFPRCRNQSRRSRGRFGSRRGFDSASSERSSCCVGPANRIGWVLCGITLGMGASQLASAYARYALVTEAGRWPLGEAAAWIATWAFFPVLALVLALVVLYPTGRPSRFGRWILLAFSIVASLAMVVYAVRPGPVQGDTPPVNPLGIPGAGQVLDATTEWLGSLLAVIALVALIDVFQRFRRSKGVERLQFRWFFIAIAMFPVLFFASGLLEEFVIGVDGFDPVVVALAIWGNGTAAAIGIAITRHGLYEIDRLVSRTVTYAVVVGLLTAVFFGMITLLTLVLPAESDLATAAATLRWRPSSTRCDEGSRRGWTVASTDRATTRSWSSTRFAGSLRDRVDSRSGDRWMGRCGQRDHAADVGFGLGEAMRGLLNWAVGVWAALMTGPPRSLGWCSPGEASTRWRASSLRQSARSWSVRFSASRCRPTG